MKIFVINPGSTSTKVGLFCGRRAELVKTIRHTRDQTGKFSKVMGQLGLRLDSVDRFLEEQQIDLGQIDFFIGRGGLLRPLDSGLYAVNQKMIQDLKEARYGQHASNLGAVIAHHYARRQKKEAYVMDPVCVDELEDMVRVSGHPLFERRSIFHALNQKKVARQAAVQLGSRYRDINLVVAHMGGGISVALHKKGRVADVNHATQGEGPFTPERSGGLAAGTFLQYVLENKLNYEQAYSMIMGQGGLAAYFKTTDFKGLMARYRQGEQKVKRVIDAMAYQIAQEIAARSVLVAGDVAALVLTGGLAHDQTFVDLITARVAFICPRVLVYPGENELEAMAEGIMLGLVEHKIPISSY